MRMASAVRNGTSRNAENERVLRRNSHEIRPPSIFSCTSTANSLFRNSCTFETDTILKEIGIQSLPMINDAYVDRHRYLLGSIVVEQIFVSFTG